MNWRPQVAAGLTNHYTVPYGYPYEVSSEIEVGEYRIPEGDLVLMNYRSCHMDYTYGGVPTGKLYWFRRGHRLPRSFLTVRFRWVVLVFGHHCCKPTLKYTTVSQSGEQLNNLHIHRTVNGYIGTIYMYAFTHINIYNDHECT